MPFCVLMDPVMTATVFCMGYNGLSVCHMSKVRLISQFRYEWYQNENLVMVTIFTKDKVNFDHQSHLYLLIFHQKLSFEHKCRIV